MHFSSCGHICFYLLYNLCLSVNFSLLYETMAHECWVRHSRPDKKVLTEETEGDK